VLKSNDEGDRRFAALLRPFPELAPPLDEFISPRNVLPYVLALPRVLMFIQYEADDVIKDVLDKHRAFRDGNQANSLLSPDVLTSAAVEEHARHIEVEIHEVRIRSAQWLMYTDVSSDLGIYHEDEGHVRGEGGFTDQILSQIFRVRTEVSPWLCLTATPRMHCRFEEDAQTEVNELFSVKARFRTYAVEFDAIPSNQRRLLAQRHRLPAGNEPL
jgi:hypothetical protein